MQSTPRWLRCLWPQRERVTYRGTVTDRPTRMRPVPRPSALDGWAGMWVAVKDGKVIRAAPTSTDLVRQVIEMGPAGEGAVAQFVPPHSESVVIGVG